MRKILDTTGQSALADLISSDHIALPPKQESLEQFLNQFPRLWRDGEGRTTNRNKPSKAHDWRTRKDAFEGRLVRESLTGQTGIGCYSEKFAETVSI